MSAQEVNSIEFSELLPNDISATDAELAIDGKHAEKLVEQLKVKLVARLGETQMSVQQLRELKAGEVIALNTYVDQEIGLYLDERLVAKGRLVACDEYFGIQISDYAENKKP